MTSRVRSLALGVLVILATIGVPAATGGAVACAGESPHAGLVVDTGARVIELCVALDDAEVSGLHLIELAAEQHGLAYGFGMGGGAVCRLDGVGPAGDDCFAEYPEYWGYWHGDGRGGWAWASTGAGSFRVGDGDLEGWVWGTGDSGATHREPPALGIDDVCAVVPPSPEPTHSPTSEPEPSPKPTPTPAPSRTPSPSPGTTSPRPVDPSGTRTASPDPKPSEGDRSASRGPSASASPSPSSAEAMLAAGTTPPPAGGPPAELLVALGLGAALTAGGWLRLRGRSKDSG